jgi:hypothetical protein
MPYSVKKAGLNGKKYQTMTDVTDFSVYSDNLD